MSAPVVAHRDTGRPLGVQEIQDRLDEFGIDAAPATTASGASRLDIPTFSPRCLVNRVSKARPRTRDRTLFGAVKDAVRQGILTVELESQLLDAALSTSRPDDPYLPHEAKRAINSAKGSTAGPAPQQSHVAPTPADHDALEDIEAGFWDSRESLRTIWDCALACMISPWGLLGTVLIYTLDFIPYYVALPGIADDDSPGSLNLFLGLVGQSGGNKGRTCRVARWLVGRTDTDIPPGSGEGLVKIYVRRPTPDELRPRENDDNNAVVIHNLGGDQFVYKRHNAVIDCAEVQSLAALGSRTGSTLDTILRQGFSGETLGFGYSDETKRLIVPADNYRLTMIVGVQPEHSDVLLGDAAGGTPQRFLWTPVTDPRVSRRDRPRKPPPIRLVHPDGLWPSTFGMCEAAREEIERAAEERAQGVGDPLDGHALFVRAKVAAALAVLDGGRVAIADEDWRLAGSVMAVSNRTRARCEDALVRAAERSTAARGRGEGIRASIAEETIHERAARRVVGVLVRASTTHGPMTTAALRKRLAARDRRFFDDAFAMAIDGNHLIQHDDGQVKVP